MQNLTTSGVLGALPPLLICNWCSHEAIQRGSATIGGSAVGVIIDRRESYTGVVSISSEYRRNGDSVRWECSGEIGGRIIDAYLVPNSLLRTMHRVSSDREQSAT